MPDRPIAYWIDKVLLKAFEDSEPFAELAAPRQGLATGDNDRFLRLWSEVSISAIGWGLSTREEALQSRKRWFPYSKGGPFRRWYGNNYLVVDWKNDGEAIRNFRDENGNLRSRPQNMGFFFKPAITWSLTSFSRLGFAARYRPAGFIFDINGMSAFPEHDIYALLSLLNSVIAFEALKVINPSFSFQAGDIARIPAFIPERKDRISGWAKECVNLSKGDWNALETSWGYSLFPLLVNSMQRNSIKEAFDRWRSHCQDTKQRLLQLEREINAAFCEAYGVTINVQEMVKEEQIVTHDPNAEEDIKRLISYSIGCMMGRYSLDQPGLIYAHSGNNQFWEVYHQKHNKPAPAQNKNHSSNSRYSWSTFSPDQDGIIPITDTDWFPDDAANRFIEFISVAWPKEHLEENLKFVAESLGPNRGESPP